MRFASQRIQIAAKYSSEQHPSELSLGPASSENSTRKVVLSVEQCVVFSLSWKLKMGPPLECWRTVVSKCKVSCLHTSVPWSLKMSFYLPSCSWLSPLSSICWTRPVPVGVSKPPPLGPCGSTPDVCNPHGGSFHQYPPAPPTATHHTDGP